MSEVEVGAIASLGGLFRRTKGQAFEPGGHCENCETVLLGPWCYVCGQQAEHERGSIGHVILEAFEGMFHADGRLWRTLPRLALHPGQLTRDYVEGKRSPQAPPFSMFLVVVVMFVFVGALTQEKIQSMRRAPPAERQAAAAAAEAFKPDDSPLEHWIKARAQTALAQPERFSLVAEQWEHRMAILMLPIAGLLLTLLFAFQRRFTVYEHLIFSMHSLAFAGFVLTFWMLLMPLIGHWATWLWLLLPIHLFIHMRRFYSLGVAGTLTRMTLLGLGSGICFSLLMFGLILISLSTMAA